MDKPMILLKEIHATHRIKKCLYFKIKARTQTILTYSIWYDLKEHHLEYYGEPIEQTRVFRSTMLLRKQLMINSYFNSIGY